MAITDGRERRESIEHKMCRTNMWNEQLERKRHVEIVERCNGDVDTTVCGMACKPNITRQCMVDQLGPIHLQKSRAALNLENIKMSFLILNQ